MVELNRVSGKLEEQGEKDADLARNFIAKQPSGTSGGNSPCNYILGIRPDKIAKGTLVRNFLCSSHNADLVECAYLR